VAVMDLAVIVCGRHGLAVIVLRVAVMDFFEGRYRLWPSWIWPSWSSVRPSWFVAATSRIYILCLYSIYLSGRDGRLS